MIDGVAPVWLGLAALWTTRRPGLRICPELQYIGVYQADMTEACIGTGRIQQRSICWWFKLNHGGAAKEADQLQEVCAGWVKYPVTAAIWFANETDCLQAGGQLTGVVEVGMRVFRQ